MTRLKPDNRKQIPLFSVPPKSGQSSILGDHKDIERRPGRRYVSEVLKIAGYDPENDRHAFNRHWNEERMRTPYAKLGDDCQSLLLARGSNPDRPRPQAH